MHECSAEPSLCLQSIKRSGLLLFLLGSIATLGLVSTVSSIENSKAYSSVGGLLLLVTLLVSGSLGLVRGLLLLVQGLPPLTEDLADLACESQSNAHCEAVREVEYSPNLMPGFSSRTLSRVSLAKNM